MPRLTLEDFCGPSYTERSIDISSDRTVNLYPVLVNPQTRPPTLALVGTPGLRRFCHLSGGPIRGLFMATNGRVFAMAGTQFYELFQGGTYLLRGTIPAGTQQVSMDDNGLRLMLVDGTGGWVFTFASNLFQPITDPDFPGADTNVFIDGYFAFNIPGTGRFGITGLYDPLNVDGLDIATAEGRADPLVTLIALHRELRLIGSLTVESWFNSGNPDFPFQAIPGTLLEQGSVARDTVRALGNSVVWLHANREGMGKVLAATGYTPAVVSQPPQEAAWATYLRRDDAVAWTYTESGHDFYVLTFPSANATWVLDLTTGFWHERAFLKADGTLGRHLAATHCVAFGLHLVGDYRQGTVYQLTDEATTDDGREIVRMRRFPHVRTMRERLFHSTLEVHVEQGTLPLASLPRQLQLRWSNDGGHTWSTPHWRESGPQGHYRQRARWHKLGAARDRVYELRSTGEGPARWIAAYLDVEQGVH